MNQTSMSSDRVCTSCALIALIARIQAIPKQLNNWLRSHGQESAPIFLRLLLAYEFGEAGLEKLHGDNWFAYLDFPFPFSLLPPDLSWTLATGLEIIGPIAFSFGLMIRFFSAALIVLTIVAIAAVHWPTEWHSLAELWKGYAITNQGYGNFKLPLIYLLMLSALLLSGGGRFSIDAWLTKRSP